MHFPSCKAQRDVHSCVNADKTQNTRDPLLKIALKVVQNIIGYLQGPQISTVISKDIWLTEKKRLRNGIPPA